MSLQTVPNPNTVSALRNHTDIVREYGASNLWRLLRDKGFDVSVSAVQRWADRNSIPNEYWNVIAEEGIATLNELATAADPRTDA